MSGYTIDFCCLSASLGIEADGGQHLDAMDVEYDQRRSDALLAKGIRIIRFSDYDILKYSEAVEEAIYRELATRPPPRPSPGIPGEGE
jgi:very-short-patch-repair endonuclease